MAVTKDQIIATIYSQCGYSKQKSRQLLETCIEIIKKALKDGEDVLISGFAKFFVKEKDERRGRNPQIGDDLMLRPRKVITFRCSRSLKEKINGKS